jgi:chemotaxis protein methyltransferase CheR
MSTAITRPERASVAADGEEAAPREFAFTDRDFQYLREAVHRHTGIALADTKREMVYGRLSRRLRALNLGSFAEYCALLEEHAEQELGQLVNAITTNLTAFFRERHHFQYLRERLLPEVAARSSTRRLRIWSAGCSTGAEPYSIAIVLRETSALAGWDVRILATDIDTNVLETASRGVYNERDTSGLDPAQLKRWFLRGRGPNNGRVRVKDELRSMIAFRRLNLIERWPMREAFDIVFCRNVVIYFDKPTQTELFGRFADLMVERGHLFVGHSESLFKVSDRFDLIGQTIYRRKPQAGDPSPAALEPESLTSRLRSPPSAKP